MSGDERGNAIDRPRVAAACLGAFCFIAVGAVLAANSITWNPTQALGFGRFAAGSGGSVTISPAGARSSTGGVALLSSGPGSAAQFSLTGTPSLAYSITLPGNGTVALSRALGGSMAVTQFTSTPSGSGQLNASGLQVIYIGATLNVSAGAAPGRYTGSFELMLDYN
jgi:hypothetical protein